MGQAHHLNVMSIKERFFTSSLAWAATTATSFCGLPSSLQRACWSKWSGSLSVAERPACRSYFEDKLKWTNANERGTYQAQ